MSPDITMNWIIETPEIFSGLTGVAVLLRLMLATVIGGIVGWERGRHGRAAGLRTHIMVCLGATLASLVGMYTTFYLGASGDPNRVAAQVISGIGFLGAGTIIVHRNMIRGLTTAASLWTTAGIGLAIGSGMYVVGVGTAVVLLVVLIFVRKLEVMTVKKKYKVLKVFTVSPETFIREMEQILGGNDIRLHEIKTQPVPKDPEEKDQEGEHVLTLVEVYLHLPVYANVNFLLTEFSMVKGVRRVET